MFLSTFESSVDAKKRVSIPASFRKSLGGGESVYLWPSLDKPCIEGCGQKLVYGYDASISDLDLMDPRRYALATAFFGEMREARLEEGGRIVLDPELAAHAGINGKARFVGLGDRFQIWEPARHDELKQAMRQLAAESLNLLKPKPPTGPATPPERPGFE